MPKFACPNCGKSLKTSVSVPAGKKIKCPGCSHVFRLPDSTELVEEVVAKRVTVPPETPRPATRKASKQAPADEESSSQDEPAPRRGKKKAAKNKNMLMVLGGVAAVLGLLAVAAFVWPGFLVGNTNKTKALASVPNNKRAPRPLPEKKEDPEKKDNPEAQPEVLHAPAPANQGEATGKVNTVNAKEGSGESLSTRAIMGKIGKGPQALQGKLGKELKGDAPPWDALQAQTTEYVTLASALAKNEPRRGSKESWAKLSAAFAESATALDQAVRSKNRDAAMTAHAALANACMSCHQQHKGR